MNTRSHTASDYVFPSEHSMGSSVSLGTPLGLTKRELFAAMAMQGLSACGYKPKGGADLGLAQLAVERADALLEALSETERA